LKLLAKKYVDQNKMIRFFKSNHFQKNAFSERKSLKITQNHCFPFEILEKKRKQKKEKLKRTHIFLLDNLKKIHQNTHKISVIF